MLRDAVCLPVNKYFRVSTDRLIFQILSRVDGDWKPLNYDLLYVAQCVFIADCLSPRTCIGRREFWLTIPVYEYEVWANSAASNALQAVLEFGSGDIWSFEFIKRPDLISITASQGCLPGMQLYVNHRVQTCLLSEGLDSLAGLTTQLLNDSKSFFLATFALIQPQCYRRVKEIVEHLNRIFGKRVILMPVVLQRSRKRFLGNEELSQRTRSFLLAITANVAALSAKSQSVSIFENGLEAFDFTTRDLMMPGDAGRPMHPIFLSRLSDFITTLVGQPFEFRLPFLFKTKSQMLASVTSHAHIVERTVSCIHFPRRKPGASQCGICIGCQLRRIALRAVGLVDPDLQYDLQFDAEVIDETNHELISTRAKFAQLTHRLQSILEAEEPITDLLQFSGLAQKQYEELFSASARVAGIPVKCIGEHLLGLYAQFKNEYERAILLANAYQNGNKDGLHNNNICSVSEGGVT